MSQQSIRLLLADDEASLREPLAKHLRQNHNYDVDTAANGREVLAKLEQTKGGYDVALIDDMLVPAPGQEPEPLGIRLTKEIKSHYPDIEVILFTGWGMRSGLEALRAGAYRYLSKPFNLEEVGMLIQTAAEHGQLKGIAREKQILEQLMETSTALLSGQSLPEVLDIILHGVQAVGFDRVGLYLISDDGQTLEGRAQAGIGAEFVGHKRPVADDKHMQSLIADPRPQVFKREEGEPLPYEKELGREGVNQWACIPLLRHDEIIGKLSMDNKFSQRPIVEAELGPLAIFASQAAAAIEHARLYAEASQERDRSKWLASQLLALHEITQMIQAELDLASLLDLISQQAAKLLKADAGGILLLDEEKAHLTFKGSYKLGQQIVAGTRDVVGGSIAGRVVEKGEAIIANDIPNDPRFYNPAADGEGLLAIVSTPLFVGGEIIGTLDVHSKSNRYGFDENDLKILSMLATQAAVAIQNATLFEQRDRRALALEALHRISLDLTSQLRLPELVKSILDRAVELLQAKGGCLYLLDEAGKQIKVAAVSNRPDLKVGMTRTVQSDVVGRVIKGKKALSVPNYRNWPYKGRHNESFNFTVVAGAPISWQDKIWGVIAIHDEIEGRDFGLEELNLLTHLGNLAAVALENADLAVREAAKLQRLEKLARANSEIMSNLATMSLDERLNLVTRHAADILEAETCGIFLAKFPGFLSLEASYGHREGGFEKGQGFAICSGPKTGLTGHIAYEGKLFNAHGDNLTSHFAVRGDVSHTASKECYSLLAIPLKKKIGQEEELIALLRADNKKSKDGQAGPATGFTKEDEWILSLLADAVVVAIEGAKLVVQLSEQKDHWARLIASSPTGIIAIDRQGNITGFNDQAQKILKYLPEEVFGKSVDPLYDNPHEPRRIGGLLHASPDGKVASYETFVRSKEGERIPVRLAATWLYDAQENQIGSVGYFEDLRLIKAAERRLELLLKASNTVAQAENLTDSLQSLAEMIVTFLNVGFCRCFLLDERHQILLAKAAYPTPLQRDQLDWEPGPEEQIILAEWPLLAEVLAEWNPKVLRIDDPQHYSFLTGRSHRLGLKQNIQSLLLVPLKARNKVVGLLALAELRPWAQTPFSKQKQELAVAIADQVAMLIDRIRLFHETRAARERLRSFFEASNTFVSSHDPDQLLQDIVEKACGATGACGASVILIDQMGQGRSLVTTGVNKQYDLAKMVRPNGLSMQIMRTGQPEVIEDTSRQRDRVNPSAFERGIGATSGYPFSLEGKCVGVMWVDYEKPRRFSPDDIDSMRLYVNQAAIAYDSTRRIKTLNHLRQAAEALAGAAGLQEVLEQIIQSAKEVLLADSAVIWSYDAVRDRFILERSVVAGIPDESWKEFQKIGPRKGGTAYTVMERGWVSVTDINDAQQYPFLGGSTYKLLEKIGAQSFQGLALAVGEETVGVLYVNYNYRRSFSAEEHQTAQTFANHAALALQKARLLDQVRKSYNAARIVAQVTVLEDLRSTLNSVVKEIYHVLDCDVVSLYPYDPDQEEFVFPPAMIGVKHPGKILEPGRVPAEAVVRNILLLDDLLYVAEDRATDPLLGGPFAEREEIVSSVAVLLVTQEGKVGVMVVSYRKPHHFTPDELITIKLFAHQAAVAIRNAQLYDEVRQRAEQFQTLYQASLNLTAELSVEAVLQEVVNHARQLTGARYGALGVLDTEGKIKPFITSGLELAAQRRIGAPPEGRGVLGLLLREPKPIRVRDIRQYSGFTGFPPHHPEMNSFLGVPIISKGMFIGNLYMCNKLGAPEFSQEDQDVLGLLAAQAAIAIENVRLFEQTQRHALLLKTAAEVAGDATAILDINKLLYETVRLISIRFNFYHAGVFLLDGERRYAVLQAAYPSEGRGMLKRGHKLRVGQEGIIGFVTQTGRPHFAPDVEKDLYHLPNPDLPFTRSELVFPLITRGEVIGALDVQSAKPVNLRDEDIATLQMMADQLANAIYNAQQYEELKHTKGLVGARTALAWMGMVSSVWRHAIEGYAMTIQEEVDHIQADSSQEYPAKINKRLAKIKQLTKKILDRPITPPLSEEEGVGSVLVNELLRERLRQLRENEPYKSVQLQLNFELDDAATVRASPDWLRRVFDVLVDNAIEAMTDIVGPELTVSTRAVNSNVEVVFRDTGPGISKAILPKLFHEQIEKPKGAKGLGMGLLMAQTIAQTYGGEIRVETTNSTGASMVVSLPIETQNMVNE